MTAEQMFEEQRYKRNEENEEIIYLQRFGSGYFRITFDLSKEEIAIDTNMENVIESDLLQAIIQQAKELGWLEEEKKTETNLEHYLEYLSKLNMSDFALIDGRVTQCLGTGCSECDFNGDCIEGKFRWLKQSYKEPTYKLTKFEYDLLNAHKDSGMQKCLSNYRPLLELNEKGYFKDIDTKIPIREILDNCEVVK